MKISKLLVLTALWLGITSSAKAADLTGVWTMPEPQGLEFATFTDDGTRFYLYNPAGKMFFGSGNSWNTQASLRTFGYPFWVEPSTEEDAPEGSYELWDDFSNPDRGDVSGPHNLFTDDGGSTWVDHGTQGNYSWMFEIVGDYVRFQNVALIADKEEYAGTYIGWTGDYKGDKNSSVLRMIAPDTEGTSIDWKAVTEDSYLAFVESDDYQVYVNGVAAFFSASLLKAAIEAAEPVYVDVAAAVAIYNNPASTAAEMDAAVTSLKELTELKAKLKSAIEDAESKGYTETADYRAVLTNLAATKAEVEKAITDFSAALVEWGKGHASWDKPADMSGKIVNPNFDNASFSGWQGTEPNMVGSGSHGPANVAEKWNATFDTYQDIIGLPAGVYALGAQTMWRGSWNDMQNNVGPAAFLYAKAGGVEMKTPFNYAYGPLNTESMAGDTPWGVGAGEQSYTDEETGTTYYIPNDPSCFRLYAEKGLYDTKVLFVVNEGDTLRIGVKNPALLGDADNWSCFDTFTLTFYGDGADACQAYVNEAMKNFSEYAIEEGTLYTASYLTAYEQAYSGEHTASTMAEVEAVIGGINKAKEALDNNIALWKKFAALVEKGQVKITEDDYQGIPETEELADYIDFEYKDIIDAVALTNEELEAEIAKVQGWIDTMEEKSKLEVYEGKDMTKYIQNPGFDEDEDINSGNAEGWTIDKGTGGNITRGPLGQGNKDLMESALGEMNYCFEAWHRYNWDVWQEVKNLPVGMYELQVQGYVRCEVGGYTRGDELVDPYISPVYLYMNNAMSQFPSVYSECPADEGYEFTTVESWTTESVNGNLYPNSMGGAAQCFAWGMYKTTAYGLISKEGETFRIGVKMVGNQDWWCIWDSFKLIYHDPTPEMVQPLLEAELEKINLESAMGKNVYEQAAKVKADAEAAIASGDGKAMFAALSAAYDLSAAILESTSLFESLVKATEGLTEATYESENTAAIAEANALVSQIENGIANHEYEDADVEGLLTQIKQMKVKLGLPDGWENASDDNPADFTGVIENPNYEENLDGWSGTAAAHNADATNAEIFGKNYDYYQDIEGLPAGTYQVSVQAFYRAGSADGDYAAWVANPDSLNYAFLYAKAMAEADTLTYDKALTRLAAEAWTEDEHGVPGDGEVYCKQPSSEEETDGLIVPNTMVTAGNAFDEGKYANNVVTFVLKEGDVLRIGLRKETDLSNNWTIFDNWQLTYFGKNSSKEPNTSGIETLAESTTMKVEYFTLDGRKTNRVQKGIMIQKVTFGNGSTIVKKIRK